MVGFWEEMPDRDELKASNAARVDRLGAFRFQRELSQMCPFGCIDHGAAKGGDEMGVVKEGATINPAPDGPARAVCVDNYTKKDVDTRFGKLDKECFVFELEHVDPKTGSAFLVFASHTASLSMKSNLRKFLISWRGKQFTPDELQGFDCEKVVGAPAFVQVLQNHKDDGSVYANIESIMPMPPGLEKLKPSGKYTRRKDRDAQGAAAPHAGDPDDDLPF